MNNNSKKLLECKNLTVTYGNFVAVEDLSFALQEGDYLCIVGANGSGKSTLIKTLLGLQKSAKGSISFYNKSSKKNSLGYLPQQTIVQKDFPASVKEVVLSGCANKLDFLPFYKKEHKKLAEENMKKLKIQDLKNKSFQDLSGGQQQRVLLARALCAAEKILILDEPVTGLDPVVTDELYDIVKELNKNEKMCIIMISHDIHRATENATHILHMNKKAEFFGTSQKYKETSLYHTMSHMEVCCTHTNHSCSKSHYCNASHI